MSDDPSLKTLQSRLIPAFLLGTLGLAVVVAIAFAAFVFSQDLKVVATTDGVAIDVMWLGEYQSNVQEIRITEVTTGNVLWSLRAANGESFPLWQVPIRRGNNSAVPDGVTGAKVVAPASGTFELAPSVKYRVDLWSVKDFGIRRHVSKTFQLPGAQGA